MQKKLIALAIAGLSSAAFAQSNVTISGQFKLGFESVSAGGATAPNSNLTSRTRVTDNNSNIKFAGEENLGNGLTAWFQVESALGTSDNVGTTGRPGNAPGTTTTLGSRNTAVGLKGAWGNAFMGKWDAYYNSLAPVDGMGLTDGHGLATSALSILHTNGQGTAFGGRLSNVVAYVTPNFSGFDATIAYSTSSENTAANITAKDKAWAFNPKYVNGPISAFYAYMKQSNVGAVVRAPGGPAVAGDTGNTLTANRLGGAYTFPMGLKVGLIWDKNKVEVADGANGFAGLGVIGSGGVVAHARQERTAWALPIVYTTGAHKVNFTYAKAGDLKTNQGTLSDSGAKMYVLGYEYSLSKRTSVAASYLNITNGANASYDGWHPSSSVNGTSGGAALLPAGADPRIVQFNVRHAF